MYSQRQSEVLAMSDSDYRVVLFIMVIMMVWPIYVCFTSFRHLRSVDWAATSAQDREWRAVNVAAGQEVLARLNTQ